MVLIQICLSTLISEFAFCPISASKRILFKKMPPTWVRLIHLPDGDVSNRAATYSPGLNSSPSPSGASSTSLAKWETWNWLSPFWEQRMCLNYRKDLAGQGILSDSHTVTNKEGASSAHPPSQGEDAAVSTSHYCIPHENASAEPSNTNTIPTTPLAKGKQESSPIRRENIRSDFCFLRFFLKNDITRGMNRIK